MRGGGPDKAQAGHGLVNDVEDQADRGTFPDPGRASGRQYVGSERGLTVTAIGSARGENGSEPCPCQPADGVTEPEFCAVAAGGGGVGLAVLCEGRPSGPCTPSEDRHRLVRPACPPAARIERAEQRLLRQVMPGRTDLGEPRGAWLTYVAALGHEHPRKPPGWTAPRQAMAEDLVATLSSVVVVT